MPNLSENKVKIPEQSPETRRSNFKEVSLGYTLEQAKEEAERCLQCKNRPCVGGCPVNVQIPEFIKEIREGNIDKAKEKILETNMLPAICGRVCPQENQCEKLCVRGRKGEPVAIGRLERFAADNGKAIDNVQLIMDNKNLKDSTSNYQLLKVAVIGSGPAGLTCASDLAKMGYNVTIFEALHEPGGVLMYGIPEFRLPKEIVKKQVEEVEKLGVEIKYNMVVGRILNIDELFEMGYKAVFIGSGAGLPIFMNIPGENLNGVMSANEFLTRVNLMKAYSFPNNDTPIKLGRRVAVVGGGNVAMDSARCALRLGADKVYIIYRRSEAEMPARAEEVHHAKEEGIEFRFLTNPIGIIGNQDGWVEAIECLEMELGEPDDSGRRTPVEKAGSKFNIDVDTVIMAIGTKPNSIISDTSKRINKTKKGGIEADLQTGKTSREGVYAGGDIVSGAATVILAMGAGKKAAIAIDEYIKGLK